MRDDTVYGLVGQLDSKIQQIVQFIQGFTNSVRLDSTGKEIRLLALQQLLIKKNIITEAEMTDQAGSVMQEMQKQAEEEAKKTAIVPATPEQTAQVNNTPAPAEVAPTTPPQA